MGFDNTAPPEPRRWVPEAEAPHDGEGEFLSCTRYDSGWFYHVVKWMGNYWVETGDYQEVGVDYVMCLPAPPTTEGAVDA